MQACPYDARFINHETQTADKCTFCEHRPEAGLLPACVESCVGGARKIGNLNDEHSEVATLLRDNHDLIKVLKPELNTSPHVFYIGLPDEFTVVALTVVALLWAVLGITGQAPSFSETLALYHDFGAWKVAMLGSIVGGVILAAFIWQPTEALARPTGSLLLALAMLAAAWVFRWIVFMPVQTVPKFGAGLYLQGVPWGSDGVLGMLGVFGLVAALLAIVTCCCSASRPVPNKESHDE